MCSGFGKMSRLLAASALALCALSTACDDDDVCKECDYIFDWSSDGQLTNTISRCEEIECDVNLCGRCIDIEYNRSNLPISGTCYSCPANLVPDCPADFALCEDYLGDRCVDLQNDPLHCGRCGAACGENEECIESDCVPRAL